MKILLLNPSIDAQHELSVQLKKTGAVLLFAGSVEEAWKIVQVHGSSLDLAIIHREGKIPGSETQGEGLIAKIKADPNQADLPIIFSSSIWKEPDFHKHQQTPQGANAYLRWPFTGQQLTSTIQSMFGNGVTDPNAALVAGKPGSPPPTPEGLSLPSPLPSLSVVLEEPSRLMPPPPVSSQSGLELQLEAPQPAIEVVPPPGSVISATGQIEIAQGESETSVKLLTVGGRLASSPPAPPAEASAPSFETAAPISETGSIHIGVMEDDELEPHERFDLARRMAEENGGAGAGTSIMATSVLEPQAFELDPAPQGMPVFPSAESDSEEDLASELPYLFRNKPVEAGGARNAYKEGAANPNLVFAEPVGDAVVPGGAVQSPDMETLKKYLLLREQDVAILSNQLKSAMEQVGALEKQLKEEGGRSADLAHTLGEHERRIEEFEKEKALALQGLQSEIDELKFHGKAKSDKARVLEAQVLEATDEIERLKERVRSDIRKIRVREKELENKLEIMKKDSEALIAAREGKIIELKRKVDLLEFNMDLLQDRYVRERDTSAQLRERLAKAAQVVRVAGGLLDTPGKAGDAAGPPLNKAAEPKAS